MISSALALAQGGPRFDGDAVSAVIGFMVVGALILVFWASRPSVIARYQTPAAPEPTDAPAPAEAEPRA